MRISNSSGYRAWTSQQLLTKSVISDTHEVSWPRFHLVAPDAAFLRAFSQFLPPAVFVLGKGPDQWQ